MGSKKIFAFCCFQVEFTFVGIDLAAGEIIYDIFQDDFMRSNLENQYVSSIFFTHKKLISSCVFSFNYLEITELITQKNLFSLTEKAINLKFPLPYQNGNQNRNF